MQRKSTQIAIVLTFIFSTLKAQQIDSIKNSKNGIDSILASEQLIMLDGQPITFCSMDAVVRSKVIRRLIHNCINFYEPLFPGNKFNVRVYILNKPDWVKAPFEQPYGMPFYNDLNEIMVIAAEKNALRRLSGLPDDPEKSDSILSSLDYQPLHELGHYFFFTLNKVKKEKWLNEFLATYFLICFLKSNNLEPNLEEEMKADYPVTHRTLEDFQKFYGGVGPRNYGWYQVKFAKLGFELYPSFKLELIRLVLQNYAPNGKNLDGVTLLKGLAPETMNAWLETMQ
jgi:hypothetical protein